MSLVAHIFCCSFAQFSTPAHIVVSVILTLFALTFLCVSHSNHIWFLFCSKLATPLSISQFFCPTVASNSYSTWDECPSNLGTLPTFSELANMTRGNLTSPVAAAATAQVKLCPYDEEEPYIWFRLIEAQFAAAGIKSEKLKNANALASLPKQVLWDILDTLDVCNDSAKPFNFLKNTLLGQFRKSKWQSYFELLCLPMEMQGLKLSVLMGKLKQHPPSRSFTWQWPFSFNVLIRLPPSMREAVGACTHETAAAMVKVADALWDARCGHDTTVAAASTQQSRSPAPSNGKRGDKRSGNARLKKSLPFPPRFLFLSKPWQWCV